MVFLFRVRSMYFMRDPVRELVTWTRDELDYRREASHCDIVRSNAIDNPTERIPQVYWNLTRSRVLTMEFLEGPSVMEYIRLVEHGSTERLEELESATASSQRWFSATT